MFTPWPYQIELVNSALKRNTIACLNSPSVKSFVWMTYLREIGGHNFPVISNNEKAVAFALFGSDHVVEVNGVGLQIHLDTRVTAISTVSGLSLTEPQWSELLEQNQVIVTTPSVFAKALTDCLIDTSLIGVLVLDDCHKVIAEDSEYRKIVETLHKHKPYMLGLTCSLLKDDISASALGEKIRTMEKLLGCKAETATDLIALDGCSPSKPDEKIVLCGGKKVVGHDQGDNFCPVLLTEKIREILLPAIEWLKVCQITASTPLSSASKSSEETSSTSTAESDDAEVKPTKATSPNKIDVEGLVNMSLTVLSQVVLVLDVLGLWCAHRLVIMLLKQLQKNLRFQGSLAACDDAPHKWKYFLLRYTDSHLRTVYKMCQTQIGNKKKVDLQLVTPKVDRLLQVLKEYKPPPEVDRKTEQNKYNDRSESGYVSWWQDSEAEEDEEEQMLNRGREKKSEEEKAVSGRARALQYHHPNSLCGIVFVRDKHVALMLQRLLKEVSKEDPDLWHVASANITSLSNGGGGEMLDKPATVEDMYHNPTNSEKLKQEDVLRSFRSHEVNLLVATNCLQEYAEIPKCNLVLRFDTPTTYRSYILSKSRARAANSTFMMLANEDEKADFLSRLQEYKKIEKVLQIPYSIEPSEATVADDYLDSVDTDDSEDELAQARAPPYFTTPTICATLNSAVHIVNRYCSRLPTDSFTHLSARCEVLCADSDVEDPILSLSSSGGESYVGILQLPINSQVRSTIKGPVMPTALLAQKAAALEACRVLHQAREIDDHFMPVGKEMVKYAAELHTWPDEKTGIPGRPGTTKRRQTYTKEVPAALSNCLPKPDIPLFLYEIEMRLKTRLPENLNVRRRRLHAPEETTRCFGILTAKPLFSTVGFPIFTRSGEESVRIRLCRSFITLGEHHIKMVRSFHHYIFSDMLRIDRDPLAYCPEAANLQILVVILDKTSPDSSLDIDWRFMSKVAANRRVEERMRADPWFRHKLLEAKGGKKLFTFHRSKYEDGVVVAKYRSPDQPNRFYVAEIKDHLNPYSPFPSSEYESFHHYYKIKYGLDIRCLNQPLLDVDHTSSRLNLLTPRYMNHKGKVLPVTGLEKKRAKYETLTNRQILVPELCDLHPIPASLWRKAVCVPSVLYRLSSILLAEELRTRIFRESNIGNPELPFGSAWPDLDFGWDVDAADNDAVPDCETPANDVDAKAPDRQNGECRDAEEIGSDEKVVESDMKADSDESDFDYEYDSDDYKELLNFERPEGGTAKSKSVKRNPKQSTATRLTPVVTDIESVTNGSGDSARPAASCPSPGLILQALTLSNASDGFNLERLEMLGDSFLKHAVTLYLFCTYPEAHEGKLSYMRSKKVSNYNLYRIGKNKKLPGKMTAHIFDPVVNWLPPGYVVGKDNVCTNPDDFLKKPAADDPEDEMEIGVWTGVPGQTPVTKKSEDKDAENEKPKKATPAPVAEVAADDEEEEIFDEDEIQMIDNMLGGCLIGGANGLRGGRYDQRPGQFTGQFVDRSAIRRHETQHRRNPDEIVIDTWTPIDVDGKPLCPSDPLIIDLHTQHSLADKSVADCVEAILGAYLTTCGLRPAQLLLCYFGLRVLPPLIEEDEPDSQPLYGFLTPPENVLLDESPSGIKQLNMFTKDLSAFERKINYTFKNKAYLLQAFTHASYYLNTITDCYQRLEFLGDAVLDFLITRQLFNDPTRRHSPGALTDLRSALVNNTIFASLAVRHDFHKFFKAISPEMHHIVEEFVHYQLLQEEAQGMDAQLAKKYYPAGEDGEPNEAGEIIVSPASFVDPEEGDEEEEEDVEVPKALGDIFESVAGAVYMDSGMDLDEVWRVYEPMMGPLIRKFSACVPRAPVRELLEMEPETAKFSWAEKRCDGKVRVTVEVIGKGSFKGVGRSFRIAKSAAARRALRFLKSQDN